MRFLRVATSLFLVAVTAHAAPALEKRQSAKLVAAHFMVGIVPNYGSSDWAADMQAAQAIGIDAFALNIATDSYTDTQLALAYAQAQNLGFKLFISFDFAYFGNDPVSSTISRLAQVLQTYAGHPAALTYNGKAVVSTFIGDSFGSNWNSVRSQVSTPLELLPNWQASSVQNNNVVDGAFSWLAWPSNNNQPIAGPLSTSYDQSYVSALNGKPYMAPVSPWFFTHFSSKNWIFASDDLFVTRWNQILSLQPPLIEIVTWNDYGESSYIGPYSANHADDGSSQWANGFPHDSWRTLAKPYIAAYKSGSSTPTVTSDKIVYWYRPHPKTLTCTGDSLPKPTGSDYDADSIFVATMLTSPAQLIVQSGGNAPVTVNVGAGIVLSSVPMAPGTQQFKIQRNGCTVISGNGGRQVDSTCQKYNFNAYVGELSPSGSCTPATTTTPASPPATSTPPSGSTCNHGQGSGNYAGLCDFCCFYGYCPTGVCTCTSFGAPNNPPPATGQNGIPANGLDASYSGLCSFACNHGYCPSGACQYA